MRKGGGLACAPGGARRRVVYFADIDWIAILLREVGYDDVV